jgi:hypothetical protein
MEGLTMSVSRAVLALNLVLSSVACAKLEYVKIPTPTQHDTWNDEKQKEADKMEGVRYYLPRPFVHLKQSVPVAQRMALVSFLYDPDKKRYQVQYPDDAPSWLKKVTPSQISITQALAVVMATEKGAIEQAGEPGESGGEKTPSRAEPPPSTLSAKTGFINDSDPITHLSDILDVVYLPDFEEQYAIQVKSGLGKVDIETRLRNGWAAEVFSQKVDNSNLVPYVIRQVEKASDAAAKVASTWWPVITGVGAPAVALTSKLTSGAEQQAGEVEALDAKTFLGELLIFKVAEVRVAQPGLYPILKPREIRQWLKTDVRISADDQDEAFNILLLNSLTPWVRPDVAFIPSPPFTVVGFNATTEVFIASATSRISMPPVSQKQKDDKTEGLRTKIKEYLVKNVSAAEANAIKTLTATNIKVDKGDITGSRIELQNINKFASADKSAYTNWIKQTLKFSDDEIKKVELKLKSNDTILEIAIPHFDLDQLIKKLQ